MNDGFINDFPVFFTDHIIKTVYRRNHHKYRINKKWHKRYGMIDVSDDEKIVQFNGTLYMTEKCFERVRKAMSE